MKHYVTPITKHTRLNLSRLKDMKKPFEFCCDISRQNPERQYDVRNPPFESSFANTPLVVNCPAVQLRIEDNAKPPIPVKRVIGVYREDVEIKKSATYGRSKKGRGPLMWFLEDEIELARNILAEEKKARWEEMHETLSDKPKTKKKSKKKIVHKDGKAKNTNIF